MERIVIAGPFNEPMRAALREALPAEEFELVFTPEIDQGLLDSADHVILRTLSIGKEQLASMDRTRLIQRWGAGYDTVDIAAAGEKGIQVAVTVGMNAVPVSEMTLALALAVYRNLVPLTNDVMNDVWSRERYSKRSYTISGKTVGVYGSGSIGKKVIRLFRAFGAEVIYYDLFRMPESMEQELGAVYVPPERLFAESDILTLHAPLTAETMHCVNSASLARMKDGAVLINTAREELVDYPAVAQALRDGKLLGAGFDAIEESFMKENPFRGMSNVVLTAHLGGNTVDNAVHMARRCAEQIRTVSAGGRLQFPHLVNGEYIKK